MAPFHLNDDKHMFGLIRGDAALNSWALSVCVCVGLLWPLLFY